MKQINYILVNETSNECAVNTIRYSKLPHLGQCIECFASSRYKIPGSKERKTLIDELCRLRKQWPMAPILGVSEVDTSSSYAPIKVSAAMNALRREMSDMP